MGKERSLFPRAPRKIMQALGGRAWPDGKRFPRLVSGWEVRSPRGKAGSAPLIERPKRNVKVRRFAGVRAEGVTRKHERLPAPSIASSSP